MLTVVLFLALGVGVARWPGRPAQLGRAFDWFVVRIAFPARIITLVPELELTRRALVPVAAQWGVMVVLMGAIWSLGRFLGWSRRTTGTLLCVVPFGNTAFLGFPVVDLLLGGDQLGWALLYDQLGSFLALATVGTVLLGVYGSGDRAGPAEILRRTVTFPTFVALVAGFVLRLTGLPGPVEAVLVALGATLVPLAIISVGMRLRIPRAAAAIGPLATGIGLRVVLAPLVLLAVGAVLGLGGDPWAVSVLQAGMSSGVVASILAADHGLDGELAAGMSGLGVVPAVLLAPVWAGLAT